jgi:hypothetical protein
MVMIAAGDFRADAEASFRSFYRARCFASEHFPLECLDAARARNNDSRLSALFPKI